jgi:hypothetical protein
MMDFWTHANSDFLASERMAGDLKRITAHYPRMTPCTASGCGWNSFTHSAIKSDCIICEGKGQIVTWQRYPMRARVSWAGMMQLTFVAPTPGIEQGDVVLTIAAMDKPLIDTVMASEEAYLEVDDKVVRPSAIQLIEVPHVGQEYQIVCTTFQPSDLDE